jgi:hypothetical protein
MFPLRHIAGYNITRRNGERVTGIQNVEALYEIRPWVSINLGHKQY